MNKKQIISGIVALGILTAFIMVGFHTSKVEVSTTPALWPSEESGQGKVEEKSEHYTITAVYPKTQSDVISMYFKSFVDEQVSQFKEDTSWVNDTTSASDGDLSLDISYKTQNATTAQNYIFVVNSYTGGAHGLQFRKTFSFNKEGQLLTLANLFTNGMDGLNDFSKLVQKELMKREGADKDWIEDGAGPKEENYKSFVVTDTGVNILLDPYQVAPYSDGAIDIAIPVESFSKIANPELFPTVSNR